MSNQNETVIFDETEAGTVVHIRGEIDHHSAVRIRTELDEELLKRRSGQVFLELSHVNFMDSSGLGLMMGRYALVSRYGGRFSILNPSEAVEKMIRISGLERIFPICRDLSEKETINS